MRRRVQPETYTSYDSERAPADHAKVPGAQTALVAGAGHSPTVEKPRRTAALVLGFDRAGDRRR